MTSSTGNRDQQITFGIPLEWEQFRERHGLFLDRFRHLEMALRLAFIRTAPTSEPLDRVIFFSDGFAPRNLARFYYSVETATA